MPPGVVATPVESSPGFAASPAALGALAGPQRAQAVAALQRGHGNAAVARLLAAAAGRRAPGSPGRPIATEPARRRGTGGGRRGTPAANAAIARMLAVDRAEPATGAPGPTAEQAAAAARPSPVRISASDGALPSDLEGDPLAPFAPDPAHDFALDTRPRRGRDRGFEAAAHDAAPAPEQEARGPPAGAVPDSQAPPPAVDQLDGDQGPSQHAEAGVDGLRGPSPSPPFPPFPTGREAPGRRDRRHPRGSDPRGASGLLRDAAPGDACWEPPKCRWRRPARST